MDKTEKINKLLEVKAYVPEMADEVDAAIQQLEQASILEVESIYDRIHRRIFDVMHLIF